MCRNHVLTDYRLKLIPKYASTTEVDVTNCLQQVQSNHILKQEKEKREEKEKGNHYKLKKAMVIAIVLIVCAFWMEGREKKMKKKSLQPRWLVVDP